MDVRGDQDQLRAALSRAWSALHRGSAPDDAFIAELEQAARRHKAADLVVDAASLRALVQAEHNHLDDALASARRAWRMARTEKLPESEYLAGVVLARLRRLTGTPYLASRITTALSRFVPNDWHRWVDWEQVLAAGESAHLLRADGPAAELKHLLGHARGGDRAAFDQARSRLAARLAGQALFRHDLHRAVVALDPGASASDVPAELAGWIDGSSSGTAPPFGLAGLNGLQDTGSTAPASAVVLALPDSMGRRSLRVSAALARSRAARDHLLDDPAGRPDAILCALALAGPRGLRDADLFSSVYGFGYIASRHRGTFDVALHRARTRVGELGSIERDEGHLRLRVDAPFLVMDPRTRPEIDDRVLALIAQTGEVSARQASESLEVPLRTVQASLRKLVDDGACLQQRAGRRVVYAVEDTTFQEPTLAGRLPPQL